MEKVVTFFNIKGGVGKTTLAVNTAAMLASKDPGSAKVLIIDLDAQAGATNYVFGPKKQIEYEKDGKTVYDLLSGYLDGKITEPENLEKYIAWAEEWNERLYVIPGSYAILNIEKKAIADTGVWLVKLRSLIKLLHRGGYNYIFIDPPATFGVLSQMSLAASDYFVVPVIPDELGFGVLTLFKSREFNNFIFDIASIGIERPLCGGIVFNRIKSDTHQKIADRIAYEISRFKLYGRYRIPVYKTRIKDTVKYTQCLADHRPIYSCKHVKGKDPTKKIFEEYFKEFYRYVIQDAVKREASKIP